MAFDDLVQAFIEIGRDVEFDPSQKRADDGKWTDGGGGGGSTRKSKSKSATQTVKPMSKDQFADNYGSWGAPTGGYDDDVLYGYQGINQTGVGFGNTEGNGMYLARDESTAAFFSPDGKTKLVKFKAPTSPLVIDNEPLYTLLESPEVEKPVSNKDSSWLKLNKQAYQSAKKKSGGKWDADLIGNELTRLMKDAGYDGVHVKSGGEEWVVSFNPKVV